MPPLGLYAEWASENMVDGICAILPEDMLSHLKKSHQRESKLGLEKAQSRHGIRQHNMKPADRFTQKLNDKPYLFSFILEGISSVPTYKGIREHTIFYVIWDNIKILAYTFSHFVRIVRWNSRDNFADNMPNYAHFGLFYNKKLDQF